MPNNTSQKPAEKARNFVAKHANSYNRASFHTDKKAAYKRGEAKHKNKENYLMRFFIKLIK